MLRFGETICLYEKAEAKAICVLLYKLIKVDVDKTKNKKRSNQVKPLLSALKSVFEMQESLALEENSSDEDLSVEKTNMLFNKLITDLIEEGIFVRSAAMSLIEEKTRVYLYLKERKK